MSGEIKAQRFVLPSADTLDRIGLAGRARARRLSAQALNDALGDERKKALEALLKHRLVTTSSDWFPEGSYHVD